MIQRILAISIIAIIFFGSCTSSSKVLVYKDDYKQETKIKYHQNKYFKPTTTNIHEGNKYVNWGLTFNKTIKNGEKDCIITIKFDANLNINTEMDTIVFMESNGFVNQFAFNKFNNTFFINENHSSSTKTNVHTTTNLTPVVTHDLSKNTTKIEQKETSSTNTETNRTHQTNRNTMRHVTAQVELTQEVVNDIIKSNKLLLQIYLNGYPYKTAFSDDDMMNIIYFLNHDGVVVERQTFAERQKYFTEKNKQKQIEFEKRKQERKEKRKKKKLEKSDANK